MDITRGRLDDRKECGLYKKNIFIAKCCNIDSDKIEQDKTIKIVYIEK